MNVTNLYIIRHGQSQGNQYNLFLGHTDLDLSEKGHIQAEVTAKYLENIHADAIYSSDLLRAFNTAKHTADKKGMEIIKSENLREIFAGDWETQSFEYLSDTYKKDYEMWVHDTGNAQCTNGEKVTDLQKRITDEIRKIAEENIGKTVFIFSHATPIRVMQAYAENKTKDEIKDVPWATNASITHIKYQDGKFIPVAYSIDKHMGELTTALPDNA